MNAADTKSLIIDKASELMMRHGVNGFSYRDISEPLGVKNAAIHYHFPTKSDLILRLIEEQHETLRQGTSEFMAYGGSARKQLEGLFQYSLDQCRKGRPVCVGGALAADYDEMPAEIRNANDRFNKDSRKWLTRVLEMGREQGEFEFVGEPASKAMSILVSLMGGRQMYRIEGEQLLLALFAQIRLELGIKS